MAHVRVPRGGVRVPQLLSHLPHPGVRGRARVLHRVVGRYKL
jgi:hypothetical protein